MNCGSISADTAHELVPDVKSNETNYDSYAVNFEDN